MTPAEILELLPYLTAEERAEVDRILANDTAIWRPLPGPQSMAYNSDADIIGYGGAAGGGKTDLALGLALTKHRRALVVRKNGTEHAAFIDRMAEVLGSRDAWNGKDSALNWRDQRGIQRKLELGSIPNAGDETKYRGRPHDLKVFDEAAELPENQVRFLMGWMRTTTYGQRCQALLTFNPPTRAEGRWIIGYFAPWLDRTYPIPAQPGELRWFATIDGKDVEVIDGRPFKHHGELIKPLSRTFIPSRVTDNPYLVGTGYMATLQALPEPLRSQMLYGDFQAGIQDDAMQVIPTAWVEAAMQRWTARVPKPPMDSLGVDVARGGKDNTIIARRHGNWFDEPLAYPGTQTPDGPTVAGLTIAATRDRAPQHIDVIGVGASPYDFLKQSSQQVVGVNVAEGSGGLDKSGRLRFSNIRSELWWRMREALDPSNNRGLALPPEKQLLADLCAPVWYLKGACVCVESREDIIKRIGRSPDWASAYILALMETPKIGDMKGMHKSSQAPYDPYANLKR